MSLFIYVRTLIIGSNIIIQWHFITDPILLLHFMTVAFKINTFRFLKNTVPFLIATILKLEPESLFSLVSINEGISTRRTEMEL